MLTLFSQYPRLADRVDFHSIGSWPTPVTSAPNFANKHGLGSLHVKREDLSHPECGGNKVRGLEFLLGRAVAKGARTILSFSSAGSHHLAKTAWHARQLGIGTMAVVVPQENARYVRRNLATALAAGARYIPANFATVLPRLAIEYLRLTMQHEPFIYLPPGGTTPLSCLGHVNAALELKTQIDEDLLPAPDYLYVPMGSLGTIAGLAVGLALAGLPTRLVGVTVSYRWYCTPGRCARFARKTLKLMRRIDPSIPDIRIGSDRFTVISEALGKGYAQFTPEAVDLENEIRDLDGLALDGTYTSKALHGMMIWITKNNPSHDARHLLWHTYAPSPSVEINEQLIARLPTALQRYFTQEPQALDERLT